MTEIKKQGPFTLRLGLLKPYLHAMSFEDVGCKSITDFIFKKLEAIVLADPIEGPKYIKALKAHKKKL